MRNRFADESGVSLIIVAVTIVVLAGMLSLVADRGMTWSARGQAQNAADAIALARAYGRAFDDNGAAPSDDNPSQKIAMIVAGFNKVWGEASKAQVTVLAKCPDWAMAADSECVQADVFRDGTAGSTELPQFFSRVWGGATNVTKARAMARSSSGNHVDCLKPWMIPDKWMENSMPPNTKFDLGVDTYTNPGYTLDDVGTILTLKEGDTSKAIAPSDFYEVGDADTYDEAITGCEIEASIGTHIRTLPGNRKGPTKMATQALLDANAPNPTIVPIAMFSPVTWAMQDRKSGTFDSVIVNIMGFQILSVDKDSTVTGKIVGLPGDLVSSDPTAPPTAGFVRIIQLVQ